MQIIDVSTHNGTIDWNKVKSSGVDGVIIRAGYGRIISHKDKHFDSNYDGAAAAGLHIGAYWYSYAETPAEAKLEAEVFLEAIKDRKFDMPVYFDIEEPKHVKLGKTICTGIVGSFCNTMENAGYFCGVYSFDSFFGTNLDEEIRKKYAVWSARVENVPPVHAPEWGMHQYSWKGRISGINGDVDMNTCIKDYPSVIIKAGLNGYGKSDTYTVRAEISGIPSAKAGVILSACENMGMTAVQSKEVISL